MKKKNAFTLIELLAVIVVLAIIALIATPIVMNTIKNAKKGAAERSADSYVKQVEVAVAEERLSKNEVLEGEYQITSDGNLCRDKSASCSDDNKIKIEMSGTKPTSGKIKITNGSVDQTSSSIIIGDYTVSYNSTKKTYEATKKGNASTGDDKPTIPDTPSTTVVYRFSADEIKIGATIDPSDTSKFTKEASTLGRKKYLKHVLDKENKVTESYACTILKEKEYCLRGGTDNSGNSFYGYAENEADYTGNMLILKQIEDAKIAGISCSFNAISSTCDGASDGASVDLDATSDGGASVYGDVDVCYVYVDGSSDCGS